MVVLFFLCLFEYSQGEIVEREILNDFYFYLNGQNWFIQTNWLNTLDVCDWYGVTCNLQKQISRLDLSSNNLVGSISPTLGNLSRLIFLDLSDNLIDGTIPESIGDIGSLRLFNLSHNRLSGSIPSELAYIRGLRTLFLQNNDLSGDINSLMTLTQLTRLNLASNMFSGTISSSISLLTQLLGLNLGNNQFGGVIPSQLWELPLVSLNLRNNLFLSSCFQLKQKILVCSIDGIDINCNCSSSTPSCNNPCALNRCINNCPIICDDTLCNTVILSGEQLTLSSNYIITARVPIINTRLNISSSIIQIDDSIILEQSTIIFYDSNFTSEFAVELSNSDIYMSTEQPIITTSDCLDLNNINIYANFKPSNNPTQLMSSNCLTYTNIQIITEDTTCYRATSIQNNLYWDLLSECGSYTLYTNWFILLLCLLNFNSLLTTATSL